MSNGIFNRNVFCIVDYRMDEKIKQALFECGISKMIPSFRNDKVYDAINGHVDISLYYDGNIFISAPEAFDYYNSFFLELGIKKSLLMGRKTLSEKYPNNIFYNVCSVSNVHIGNFNFTDESISDRINNVNYDLKVINVKQGYANCSILAIDERSFITADNGIYKKLIEEELDVLKISSGGISLFDMDYGFIGGASAVYKDDVFFFGDLDKHPECARIKEFITERGKKIISLGKEKLVDYGGMYLFENI
ncbi:DUF6873 family GME fold protein [Peptostreptococcus sp. D1]|uniref:DUF6873 family GME fold protein n=1 Tax=Peptostreptococcus sp. D1 TaxID=72304 RepID=UPI0008EDB56B|nr:hypothetical protein [Peptostreptococcus sp. D1]SFE74875.1 hypothetical protein SAMN02910278_01605 [Peptostreptococcus sp. D1]